MPRAHRLETRRAGRRLRVVSSRLAHVGPAADPSGALEGSVPVKKRVPKWPRENPLPERHPLPIGPRIRKRPLARRPSDDTLGPAPGTDAVGATGR